MGDTTAVRRIQLKRARGWRIPPNTVKVDRSTPWGNPFRIGEAVRDRTGREHRLTAAEAISEYRRWLEGLPTLHSPDRPAPTKARIREQLRGRNLACWCAAGTPCHAEVLLEIANTGN